MSVSIIDTVCSYILTLLEVALVPNDIDIQEILQVVVVPPCTQLEEGLELYFGPSGSMQYFLGSVLFVIGDHVGQCDAAGIVQPMENFPSRYSMASHDELGVVNRVYPLRDWKFSYEALTRLEVGLNTATVSKTKALEVFRENGWTLKSALWKLTLFRPLFYNRFAVCLLHTENLGLIGRHLKLLEVKYCMSDSLNERLSSMRRYAFVFDFLCRDIRLTCSRFPSLHHPSALFKKSSTGTAKLKKLTGDQVDALAQVLVVALRPLISQPDLECLAMHMQLYFRYSSWSWTDDELQQLTRDIENWKVSFVQCFQHLADVHFNYPKFEALNHFERLIRFLGPLPYQSTTIGEAKHFNMKKLGQATNQQRVERDAFRHVRCACI
jgi:hypothetical protein